MGSVYSILSSSIRYPIQVSHLASSIPSSKTSQRLILLGRQDRRGNKIASEAVSGDKEFCVIRSVGDGSLTCAGIAELGNFRPERTHDTPGHYGIEVIK
jgi:hypothetical protein